MLEHEDLRKAWATPCNVIIRNADGMASGEIISPASSDVATDAAAVTDARRRCEDRTIAGVLMSDRVTARYRDLGGKVDQRGGDYSSIARVDKRAWPCRQVGVEAKREVEKGCDALTDRAISLSGMLTLARMKRRALGLDRLMNSYVALAMFFACEEREKNEFETLISM